MQYSGSEFRWRIGFPGKISRSLRGSRNDLFYPHRIGDGQLMAASGPAGRYDFPAPVSTHTATESMLIDPFSTAWLKCPFHR